MCGIFGVTVSANSGLNRRTLEKLIETLFKLSESRGKESAGIQIYLPESRKSWIIKSDQPATKFTRTLTYRKNLNEVLDLLFDSSGRRPNQPSVFMGHSRLVTNGSAQRSENNQPVISGETTVIHNGIIVNVEEIWADNPHLTRLADVDSEVIAALLNLSMQSKWDPIEAMRSLFSQLKGSASVAWLHSSGLFLGAGTNTGDLFYARLPKFGGYMFASEHFILTSALSQIEAKNSSMSVEAGSGIIVTLHDGVLHSFGFTQDTGKHLQITSPKLMGECSTSLRNVATKSTKPQGFLNSTIDESLLHYSKEALRQLKRCSRCVLPSTFPFIEFDGTEVCNYCHSYVTKYRGVDPDLAKHNFFSKLERFRRSDGSPDVIVPLSGGRDSCYSLHLLKREFGLNPITFTYDWGMVTDLARRNIARVCGELGVQNILVSADIGKKRRNIRKNILAWLKQPDLGLVPLFMAGDKQFFSIVNTIKRQTGCHLNVWGANPLENTDFKSGFCGVTPSFDKKRLDYLSLGRRLQMLKYYGSAFVANPAYLNSSVADTSRAFLSYYFANRKDQVYLFNDVVWRESEVDSLLRQEYEFEISSESTSTWRIGDGTSAFYNYIFVTSCGFSEFDALRSNQIREGHVSREVALTKVLSENAPRPKGIHWYLSTLELDFNTTISVVNQLDHVGLHK